jgi:hypothetical protein
MGEVYRADDLKLGQPIALKFVPPGVARHAELQARLLEEVRIARNVSHPNVCRVYDIVDADGDTFIAMEYIDGEDLASLLRRIGKLAPDKAADIARQLCAGVAAIHDKGLLHRDLKPANVMLDGRGRARVMDFGLAIGAAAAGTRWEAAGTPAYMAPEQLDGRGVSAKTDVYALGLILFELLTGRRFFSHLSDDSRGDRSDFDSVKRLAADATLDPAMERVILRCLDPTPARRPESALQVAAALPGGDPIQAALAAGETPSPALVAAAGETPTLTPRLALTALVSTLVLMLPLAWWQSRDSAFVRLQPPFSRDVLEFKAREMLGRLGYQPARHTASSFAFDRQFRKAQEQRPPAARWSDVSAERPSPATFWIRFAPRPLAPLEFGAGAVTTTDPAPREPGMSTVTLDLQGRLVGLLVQPRTGASPVPPGDVWAALLTEAGLDTAKLREVPPATYPPTWGDARKAWVAPDGGEAPPGMFVEAAAHEGRPTFFTIASAPPVSGGTPAPSVTPSVATALVLLPALLALVIGGILLARANLRAGRADKRGALRVAAAVAISEYAVRMLVLSSPLQLVSSFPVNAAATAFGMGLIVWVLYVALEPRIRRSWPEALIGWNRLLEGRVSDARVGSDVLAGIALRVLSEPPGMLARFFLPGAEPRGFDAWDWIATMSSRHAAASTLSLITQAVLLALVLLLLLSFAWLAARRERRTLIAFALFFAGVGALWGYDTGRSAAAALAGAVGAGVEAAVILFVIVRFGVLGMISFLAADLVLSNVVTLQPSAWYSGPSWLRLALVAMAAAFAYMQVIRVARPPAAAR